METASRDYLTEDASLVRDYEELFLDGTSTAINQGEMPVDYSTPKPKTTRKKTRSTRRRYARK